MITLFDNGLEAQVFEKAAVGLMLLDLSALKMLFARWRAEGAVELEPWLRAEPGHYREMADAVVVVKVNAKALALYGVDSPDALRQGWHGLFCGPSVARCGDVFGRFWMDDARIIGEFTLRTRDGTCKDVAVTGNLVPGAEDDWSRATLALADRSREREAQRRLAQSEAYARALFEQSPVPLWIQDFTDVNVLFEKLRAEGVTDLRAYLGRQPEHLADCLTRIKVVDANQQALSLYGARSKEELMNGMDKLFLPSTLDSMIVSLAGIFEGRWLQQYEMETITLTGEVLDVVVRVSTMPGRADEWNRVLVAVMDITARRKAESRLRYISNHDELSGLRNRVFYVEELARLEAEGPFPVTVIIADLDRLKAVNDLFGHAAGDAMLRRAGEILRFAVAPPGEVARIGGDEFAVLLPGTDEQGGAWMMGQVEALIAQNNEVYKAGAISLSMGMATFRRGAAPDGDSLDSTVRRADLAMYESKRAYHARQPDDERRRVFAV